MSKPTLWPVVLVVFAAGLGACAAENGGELSADDLALFDSATVAFTALGGDTVTTAEGVARRTTLTTTRIRVDMQTDTAGVHQGFVHAGTCEAVGETTLQLLPLATDPTGKGSITTTAQTGLTDLLTSPHVIVYHERGGTPGAALVCGPIAPPVTAEAAPQ